jgi:hypothetical protein
MMDCWRLEIDNSPAEKALRAVALSRKNYLFCGADSGGHRAGAIYSLVGSAKLNGLDPELYLRQVLTSIAEQPINRIEELHTWKIVLAEIPTPPSAQPVVSTQNKWTLQVPSPNPFLSVINRGDHLTLTEEP